MTALVVFAGFGAFCAGLMAILMRFEIELVLTGIAAAGLCGGAMGRWLMPRPVYASLWGAMAMGALVALAAHVALSVVWPLLIVPVGGTLSELPQAVPIVLFYGLLFAGIPEVVLGALAGYVCYRLAIDRAAKG